jgi:hypothetical protein
VRGVSFWFFAGFKQDSPGCFRGPSGLSPTGGSRSWTTLLADGSWTTCCFMVSSLVRRPGHTLLHTAGDGGGGVDTTDRKGGEASAAASGEARRGEAAAASGSD